MNSDQEEKIKLWVEIDKTLKETNCKYNDRFVNSAMEVVHMKLADLTQQLEEIAQFRTSAMENARNEALGIEEKTAHVQNTVARGSHVNRSSHGLAHPHIQPADFQLWKKLR